MKKLSFLLPLVGVALISSCSQEEISTGTHKERHIPIKFQAAVTTRVNSEFDYSSTDKLGTFYVTSFINSHTAPFNGGEPEMFFSDEAYTRKGDGFTSNNDTDSDWPTYTTDLEFFAYAPSLKDIHDAALTQRANLTTEEQDNLTKKIYFKNVLSDTNLDPVNDGALDGVTTLHKGFVLSRFNVATDISQQVDFVTAHAKKQIPTDTEEEFVVPLTFRHQLSNIEILAKADNPTYNIEVAGIRIGRPYTGKCL